MQIVIDISEDTYIATCNESMLPPDVKNVVNAIKNGTPLPKGHGRLVDADKITFSRFYDGADYVQARRQINDVPTIIEADNEDKQE